LREREGLEGVVGAVGEGRAGAEYEREPRLPPLPARAQTSAVSAPKSPRVKPIVATAVRVFIDTPPRVPQTNTRKAMPLFMGPLWAENEIGHSGLTGVPDSEDYQLPSVGLDWLGLYFPFGPRLLISTVK
jgi:hypothetical protein